jgi:hypothetical protein
MPLPTILKEIITQAGEAFDPSVERGEYKNEKDNWTLYRDLMEMDAVKLKALVDKHELEEQDKYEIRQQLAAIFNYVPTLIRMVVNYIHWEQPVIDVGGDADLTAFVNNCDGSGTTLVQHSRQVTLPISLIFGFADTLVQNPAGDVAANVKSAEDQQKAGLRPQVYCVQPLQRIDWSTRPNHSYNWIRFIDFDNENVSPFRPMTQDTTTPKSYVTISAAVDAIGNIAGQVSENIGGGGFWIRSWRGVADAAGNPMPVNILGVAPEGSKVWLHDGGWLPVSRAPIQTLYYARSLDPERRHVGLSKIAMIAILTRKIIQVLSWTDEDVLSNLGIFCFPGEQPKDVEGKPAKTVITPFTVLWLGKDPKIQAHMLQGDTAIIKIKMEIVDAYIREILRLAYLIGASAQAETISSGIQGVVARNELFMELSDIAGAMDSYTIGVLALAKAHIDNSDITADQLDKKVKVTYFKGPYLIDPLETTIANSMKLIEVFAVISPEMVKQVYKQLALAVLYNEDQTRESVLTEIDTNFTAVQAAAAAERQAVVDSLASTGGGGVAPAAAVPGASALPSPAGGAPINPLNG